MSAALSGEWQTLTAPDGRPYYFNRATGQTQWTPPGAQAAPPASAMLQPTPSPVPGPAPAAPGKDGKGGVGYVPSASDARYTLASLVAKTGQRNLGQGFFELERDKLLEINLNSSNQWAWIKHGSMVARRGNVKFTRQSTREQGFAKVLKKAFTGEGMTFVKCEGTGKVFVADLGKVVSVIQMNGESLSVNGNDVLAMSGSLKYDIKLMRGGGMAAGGLFNCRINGTGMVAFTCHSSVVTLTASPNDPVYTDPNATVAWTHDPTFTTDVSMKSMLGRTTGEEFQLCFKQGYVIIQPYEELPPYAAPPPVY